MYRFRFLASQYVLFVVSVFKHHQYVLFVVSVLNITNMFYLLFPF